MQKNSNYLPLYGIIFCFAAPILLAYGLFYVDYAKHYHNPQGTLINTRITLSSLRSTQWKIAYLATTNQPPNTRLESIRLRREALGDKKEQVNTISLQTSGKHQNIWPKKIISDKQFKALATLKDRHNKTCTFFIIDPRQQAILCYASDAEPSAIDKDIRRLLKNTRPLPPSTTS